MSHRFPTTDADLKRNEEYKLILIEDMAVPCNDDKSTLLKAFPKVVPKPFSKGSITTVPNFLLSLIL